MDKFLTEQQADGNGTSEGSFTLSPENTRNRLLGSVPDKPREAKILFLVDALVQAGYDPDKCLKLSIFRWERDYFIRKVTVTLRGGELSRPQSLYDAIHEPFLKSTPALDQFTRFAYWTAGLGFPVHLGWRGGKLKFDKTSLELSGELTEECEKLTITCKFPDQYLSHQYTKSRRELANLHRSPQRLMPEEAFRSGHSLGYFEGRSKGFVLLKRFCQSPGPSGLHLDLWESPYSEISPGHLLMDREKPGRWLYRFWRPNYGRPALMLGFSSGEPTFGPLTCRAIFWVELSEKPASVKLSRGDFFRDEVEVQGPPGFCGRVCWPQLKADTYGWNFVKDKDYDEAILWCEEQAEIVVLALNEHWEKIYEAAIRYGLINRRPDYLKEVRSKMETHWG